MTGRRGRRRRKLLNDLKERRGYSDLKEEPLDRTMWRAGFGRGFGLVVRQTTKWIKVVPKYLNSSTISKDPSQEPPVSTIMVYKHSPTIMTELQIPVKCQYASPGLDGATCQKTAILFHCAHVYSIQKTTLEQCTSFWRLWKWLSLCVLHTACPRPSKKLGNWLSHIK